MRLSVMLGAQEGLAYDGILAVAGRAEDLGFSALYRSDHYGSSAVPAGASTDAWATLAGLARDTHSIALGTLGSPVTFRPAGNLAKVVATVAEMAGPSTGAPRCTSGSAPGGWRASTGCTAFRSRMSPPASAASTSTSG